MKTVEVPCLPGDVVYYNEFNADTESHFVRVMKVKSIEIEEDDLTVWCDDALGHERFVLDDFGYCVFMDRHEAMEGGAKNART